MKMCNNAAVTSGYCDRLSDVVVYEYLPARFRINSLTTCHACEYVNYQYLYSI